MLRLYESGGKRGIRFGPYAKLRTPIPYRDVRIEADRQIVVVAIQRPVRWPACCSSLPPQIRGRPTRLDPDQGPNARLRLWKDMPLPAVASRRRSMFESKSRVDFANPSVEND